MYFTLAHQNLAQLDKELRASILSNCGLMACFRVSREDADVMAKNIYGGVYDEPQPQTWEQRIGRLQKFVKREFIFKQGDKGGISILKAFPAPLAWEPFMTKAEWKEKYDAMEPRIGQNHLRRRDDIRAEHKALRESLGASEEPDGYWRK